MSQSRFAFVLFLATAIAAGSHATAARAEDPDHIDREHRLVRIGDVSLHPQSLEIGAGDAFGWLNYSSQIASVSFDASAADKMLCKQRSSFRLDGDRIDSGDIQAHQFVSLCSLAAGAYPYRVQLRSGAGGSGTAPGRVIEGTIVVR